MIKMVIKMNEEKISTSKEYTVERIYQALDRIFSNKGISNKGMDRTDTDRGIEYVGHDRPTDFAYFGKIMLGLKDQPWFMDNAKTWLYCNNDDSDNPTDFNEEDLLDHYDNNFLQNIS